MTENKNIDDKDLVFINEQWTEEEKQAFSIYLKSRKKRKIPFKGEKNTADKQASDTDGAVRKAS